ncbi:MAG: hypothetical protein ACLQU4_09520 [Limisphaerales bacterium]
MSRARKENLLEPDAAGVAKEFDWPVSRERLQKLVHEGLVTSEQFDIFSKEGALGSHLEARQRHGGYKGFNQSSVSVIISATDPRKNAPAAHKGPKKFPGSGRGDGIAPVTPTRS